MTKLCVVLTLTLSIAVSVLGQASNSHCGSHSGAGVCSISDDVFLKTDLVELGIHSYGSFGTASSLPYWYGYAYTSRCVDCRLGFICDYAGDGFDVGYPPYSGDYFVPGTPVEGWTLRYTTTDDGMAHTYTNAGLMGAYGINPDHIEITSDDTNYQQSVWSGHTEHVTVTQTTSVPYGKKMFIADTCVTNNLNVDLKNVYLMHNIDPDQEQPWNNIFSTYNYVQYQPSSFGYPDYVNPSNPDMALVVSRGGDVNFVFALGAIDARAFVTHGGFYNTDPEMYYDYDTLWKYYGGSTTQITDTWRMSYADDAVNLVFKHALLAAGTTTCFRAYFGLSIEFESSIISEGCHNKDGYLNCEMVSGLGLCEKKVPDSELYFSQICSSSCSGCCEIDSQCWCDNNYVARRIARKFKMDLNCQTAAEKYGCDHYWVGPMLKEYCPCTCPTEHPLPTPEPTMPPSVETGTIDPSFARPAVLQRNKEVVEHEAKVSADVHTIAERHGFSADELKRELVKSTRLQGVHAGAKAN